jgi:outer membrane protein assembly factor BamD (BamD/ComL family)
MGQGVGKTRGWGRWALAGLAGASVFLAAGQASAQQRHELEDGQWVQQTAHDPGSPEGELDAIRKLIARGKGKSAKELADAWIQKHAQHPLLPEAYLVRGDANVTRKHFFKSLFDYEYVIREFPGSEQFHTALRREFEVAKLFIGGTKRRLWGMRILPANDEAEEILIRIQERDPGSDLGEQASILLADYYFDKPQMDSAADAYDLFLINYPRSERREWAMLRLIQANLARFKGPRFDATGLIDAGQRLKTYRREYPASAERIGVGALLIRIDESLAMRDMIAAGWHEKRKQPLSAIVLYQRVLQDYPQTAAAQDAARRLAALGAPAVPEDDQIPPPVQAVPSVQGRSDPSTNKVRGAGKTPPKEAVAAKTEAPGTEAPETEAGTEAAETGAPETLPPETLPPEIVAPATAPDTPPTPPDGAAPEPGPTGPEATPPPPVAQPVAPQPEAGADTPMTQPEKP